MIKKRMTVLKTNVKSKSSRKRGIRRKSSKGRKIKKLSRLRKPEDMPLEQWQVALRKQFGRRAELAARVAIASAVADAHGEEDERRRSELFLTLLREVL